MHYKTRGQNAVSSELKLASLPSADCLPHSAGFPMTPTTTKQTSRARKNLGESGERVAALLLESRGYQILTRNYRTRTGELDLVAKDSDGLAFIEVRTRRGDDYGTPEESLTPRKRARLVALAYQYLQAHPAYADCAWRIDLVAIQLDRAHRLARVDVIKGAVED